MSDDPKDILEGLGDLDWDSALDEWEKNTFATEVTGEGEASRAAGSVSATKEAQAHEAMAFGAERPVTSDLAASPRIAFDPMLHGKPEGTLIAPVPRELQSEALTGKALSAPARTSVSPPTRGGLSQLFSRPPPDRSERAEATPPRPAPPAIEPSSETTMIAPRTSAWNALPPEEPGEPETDDLPLDSITGHHPAASVSSSLGDAPTVSTRGVYSRASQTDDDQNATVIRDRYSLADAETATRLPSHDERGAAFSTAHEVSGRATRGTNLDAVPCALDADRARAFAVRIGWLEEEARAVEDPTARGRAFLALSELCALRGDMEGASDFATEAREVAPDLPLAWRQARQLMPHDPHLLAEALDAEATRSPTPSARAHSVLLAADLLRISGCGDAAVERWDRACKLDPADTRAPIARAALALAQDDHTSGALRLADNCELIALDKSVATALRLRGVERPGAEVEDLPINDGLRHARIALAAGDVVAAAREAGEIAALPELSRGASWLSAALGAAHIASRRAAARALKTLANDGEHLARRQLAARGIELGDPEIVKTALLGDASFETAERAVLGILASKDGEAIAASETIASLADDPVHRPLVDAIASLTPVRSKDGDAEVSEAIRERANHVSGAARACALATLGRLLAAKAPTMVLEEALAAVPTPHPASARGVGLETALREKRWGELSEALSSLTPNEDAAGHAAQRPMAAAIVAERAGDRERAAEAYRLAADDASPAAAGLLRMAADLDGKLDLGTELLSVADEMPDGVASAVLRLEALAHLTLNDDEQSRVLENVHRAAPCLGIGAFFAERIGRRKGDLDEVLRWIHGRRDDLTDPLEIALDAVREALLVADRDPELASMRLEEAHRARPDDVALRDLYERLATEPPADRGAWREKRASNASGSGATVFWLSAALEYERLGDFEGTLRSARKAAEMGDRGLSDVIIARAEMETGDTARQSEEVEEIARTTDDEHARREALERLAHLDAFGKKNVASALLRHRSILEHTPQHRPSLRWIEHTLISEGRVDDLASVFEQIALALDGTAGGEVTAHAQHAARLRAREAHNTPDGPTAWERTREMARLAAMQPEPSLWALRALNAHSRAQKDDETLLQTTITLLERTQRPLERASLLLRASEAAARLDNIGEAGAYLEQAANEDPGDVVTWGLLAELRARAGDAREAAEACESLARTSAVEEHQLLAWYDAATIWTEEVEDVERAMSALEAAAEIDATYADVFSRLWALYAEKNLDAELAYLLEKRLDVVEDEDERVTLEVELSRAFADMGEIAKAKICLESALEKRPDHTAALGARAELCVKEGDWSGAEQAFVRLAPLLSDPAEQRVMYERLGEIYSVHAPNLARAEVALKEVLRRAPDDLTTIAKLVDIYKRQGDVERAALAQQQIVAASTDPRARLDSLIALAKIYETVGRDPRRAEQVFDSARKEFPTSVVALRAMAEFYSRQRQMPAMQILLDRAAGDARRAFAQGRFVPSLFEVLHAAFELRGKHDAARVVAATLAAVEGQPSDLRGADARALDSRLDDVLAPETMSPALRALLFHAGDALDAVTPFDVRIVKAVMLQPGTPIRSAIGSVATVVGLGALQILVSPVLGRVAVPLATNPPTLLIGEGLANATNERARLFVIVRALKMILVHASALLRGQPQEVAALVFGLVAAFNPGHMPQGMDSKRVMDMARRVGSALPRQLDPTVGVIALEAAGMLGNQWSNLVPEAHAWANRVALLAVGDPNAALDAIAWGNNEDAAPTGPEERAAWIARQPEARELMTFSVTDAYAEARMRLGLDR